MKRMTSIELQQFFDNHEDWNDEDFANEITELRAELSRMFTFLARKAKLEKRIDASVLGDFDGFAPDPECEHPDRPHFLVHPPRNES